MRQEILDLIDEYINIQNKFWSEGLTENEDTDISDVKDMHEWIKNEWVLIDQMDIIKKQIMSIINNDKDLFNRYLNLGSCLKIENYEQALIIKNEIINHVKATN